MVGKDYHAFPTHARQVCHQPGLGRKPTTSHSPWSHRIAWASSMRISESPLGTWCSGLTSTPHAEGPGFKSQCVHLFEANKIESGKLWSFCSFLFERRIPKGNVFQPKSCHWNWMSVWMRRWVDSRMSLEALSAMEILTTHSPRNPPFWDTLAGARLDAEQAQGGGSRLLSRSLWC